MKEASFRVCAGISLTVHLALVVGGGVWTHAPKPEAGGGGTKAEGGSAALGGETFDIASNLDEEDTPAGGLVAPAAPEMTELDESPLGTMPASPSPPAARPHGKTTTASPAGSRPAQPTAPPPLFGAVGDRGAADLVMTFKRAFGTHGPTDPIWDRVPIGFYAQGTVTITIDAGGSITHAVASPEAAPALRSAIERTLRIIKGHSFTARGAITRLHMVVRVTDKVINHGRVLIDASGSFELPSGRRVTLDAVER